MENVSERLMRQGEDDNHLLSHRMTLIKEHDQTNSLHVSNKELSHGYDNSMSYISDVIRKHSFVRYLFIVLSYYMIRIFWYVVYIYLFNISHTNNTNTTHHLFI